MLQLRRRQHVARTFWFLSMNFWLSFIFFESFELLLCSYERTARSNQHLLTNFFILDWFFSFSFRYCFELGFRWFWKLAFLVLERCSSCPCPVLPPSGLLKYCERILAGTVSSRSVAETGFQKIWTHFGSVSPAGQMFWTGWCWTWIFIARLCWVG